MPLTRVGMNALLKSENEDAGEYNISTASNGSDGFLPFFAIDNDSNVASIHSSIRHKAALTRFTFRSNFPVLICQERSAQRTFHRNRPCLAERLRSHRGNRSNHY